MPKNKRNAFYYYMCARQDQVSKQQGRRVPMSEMPSFVHAEWKQLPASQKKIYEAMKEEGSSGEKLDSHGVPYSLIKKQEDEAKMKVETMKDNILQTIKMLSMREGLHQKVFYIVSTSHYIVTEDGSYVPAEIGLCKFSFKEGILQEFNRILPAQIPPGYRHEANQHSELTHNLMNADERVYTSPGRIAGEIMHFINESGSNLPPLYCKEECIEQTEKILSLVLGSSTHSGPKIHSLEFFLSCVYSAVFPTHRIPESIAEEWLNSCAFDYIEDLPCRWHRANAPDAGKYCTLGSCKRYVFLMCDSLKIEESFKVTPIPGKHLPYRMQPSNSLYLEDVPSVDQSSRASSWTPAYEGEYQLGFSESSSVNYEDEFPTLGGRRDGGKQATPHKGKGVGSNVTGSQKLTGGVGRGKKISQFQ